MVRALAHWRPLNCGPQSGTRFELCWHFRQPPLTMTSVTWPSMVSSTGELTSVTLSGKGRMPDVIQPGPAGPKPLTWMINVSPGRSGQPPPQVKSAPNGTAPESRADKAASGGRRSGCCRLPGLRGRQDPWTLRRPEAALGCQLAAKLIRGPLGHRPEPARGAQPGGDGSLRKLSRPSRRASLPRRQIHQRRRLVVRHPSAR